MLGESWPREPQERNGNQIGNDMLFCNFKACPQWHIFFLKAMPPSPTQTVSLTLNPIFKYMNLWETFSFRLHTMEHYLSQYICSFLKPKRAMISSLEASKHMPWNTWLTCLRFCTWMLAFPNVQVVWKKKQMLAWLLCRRMNFGRLLSNFRPVFSGHTAPSLMCCFEDWVELQV